MTSWWRSSVGVLACVPEASLELVLAAGDGLVEQSERLAELLDRVVLDLAEVVGIGGGLGGGLGLGRRLDDGLGLGGRRRLDDGLGLGLGLVDDDGSRGRRGRRGRDGRSRRRRVASRSARLTFPAFREASRVSVHATCEKSSSTAQPRPTGESCSHFSRRIAGTSSAPVPPRTASTAFNSPGGVAGEMHFLRNSKHPRGALDAGRARQQPPDGPPSPRSHPQSATLPAPTGPRARD